MGHSIRLDQPDLLVEQFEHLAQILATFQHHARCVHDRIGALFARQLGVFLDPVKRHFGRPPENGKDGSVLQMRDAIVAPFAAGDHERIDPQYLIQFSTIETHIGGLPGLAYAMKRDDVAGIVCIPAIGAISRVFVIRTDYARLPVVIPSSEGPEFSC